jgi:hypothetical protein
MFQTKLKVLLDLTRISIVAISKWREVCFWMLNVLFRPAVVVYFAFSCQIWSNVQKAERTSGERSKLSQAKQNERNHRAITIPKWNSNHKQ